MVLRTLRSVGSWLFAIRSYLMLGVAVIALLTQTVVPNARTPLGIDEQVSYYIAAGHAPGTVFARSQQQSATPPLAFWLMRWSRELGQRLGFGTPEAWLRMPSVAAYLLALVVVFRIGESWIGPGTGGAAALLLACHSRLPEVAQQGRPYALGLLASAVAVACLLRLRQSAWRWRHLVGFVVASAALPWTHYLFASLWPAEILIACLAGGLRRGPESTAASPAAAWPAAREPVRPRAAPLSAAAIAVLMIAPAISMYPLIDGIERLRAKGPALEWLTTLPSADHFIEFIGGTTLAIAAAIALVLRFLPIAGMSSAVDRWRLGPILLIWFAVPAGGLWLAGWLLPSPSLAQPRYILPLLAPAVLLATWLLVALGGRGWIAPLALGFVLLDGAPRRFAETIRQPVRHDRCWLDVALHLNRRASPVDLVLAQTGLVETRLVPRLFRDDGFQEYATSRLSDFYLTLPLRRLALPVQWPPPTDNHWQTHYAEAIESTRRAGGTVWLAFSSDSDLGEHSERQTLAWLAELGLQPRLVRDHRVSRVFSIPKADP